MIDLIKRFFKRSYLKYLLWLRNHKSKGHFGHDEGSSNYNQRICKSICHKLINQDDSKFLIAPISGKRYIKNGRLGLFIIFDDKRITITNHIYHYDVLLSDRDWNRITGMYDNKTERIRQEFEDEMTSQIRSSLTNILSKFSENN